MGSFDTKTFLSVMGDSGAGVLESAGMAFGLPSCMLNLARSALSLLPTSLLGPIQEQIQLAKLKGEADAKEVVKRLMNLTGIIEYNTEDGTIGFRSISNSLSFDGLNGLGSLIAGINNIAGGIAGLYAAYEDISQEIQSIIDCFDKFNTIQKFQRGNSSVEKDKIDDIYSTYAGEKSKLESTMEFVNSCNRQIKVINEIILQRSLDPSLEPCFLDSPEVDVYLSGTSFKRCPAIDPGVPVREDVFRLTFGPPKSVTGQYVLTNDGLYYDSQIGGLDPIYLAISGIVPPGDSWKYAHDPNLGGKGDAVSIKSLNKYMDTIFDTEIIDDSNALQNYYNEDHFLSVLIQQRDKLIYDLSSELTSLVSEYGENSSIVKNQRQLIVAELSNHNHKVNRRKKQIEVAIKAPQIYGDNTSPIFGPGEVPINDFSYLEDYNLAVELEKQKALIFSQGEVNGVVLPLNPKYVKSSQKISSTNIDHLNVPTVGKGSIIYTPSGIQAGKVLSLTDQIIGSDLFAIYNFLETYTVLPSSIDYKTTNCATQNMYNNGQLFAPSVQSVFASGLGIPYLEGIVKNRAFNTASVSGLGSAFRLPDTPEFRDLAYSTSGFTMECWVHVPNIMDGEIGWLSATTSSLTKVLLGCENVGYKEGTSSLSHTGEYADLDYLPNSNEEQAVKGMLCGFTRDRRITQENTGYSNNNYDNDPVSSLSFFIAPTISRDLSSASFINNSECLLSPSFHKMKIDLSSSQIGSVSSNFVLLSLAFDPTEDKIHIYADGSLAATSSISTVFGSKPNIPPSVPTFKKNNSFEYNASSVDGPETVTTGPKLNSYFTPWIVGGGYTDGMYYNGNFMGGDRGGIVSGLRGHIGSLKFYSRPLNSNEVLKNYKAQEGFFKTILI